MLNDDIICYAFCKTRFSHSRNQQRPDARGNAQSRVTSNRDGAGSVRGELPRCLTGRGLGLVVETGESVDSGWKKRGDLGSL